MFRSRSLLTSNRLGTWTPCEWWYNQLDGLVLILSETRCFCACLCDKKYVLQVTSSNSEQSPSSLKALLLILLIPWQPSKSHVTQSFFTLILKLARIINFSFTGILVIPSHFLCFDFSTQRMGYPEPFLISWFLLINESLIKHLCLCSVYLIFLKLEPFFVKDVLKMLDLEGFRHSNNLYLFCTFSQDTFCFEFCLVCSCLSGQPSAALIWSAW